MRAWNKDFGTILPMDLTRGLVSFVAGIGFESIAHKAKGYNTSCDKNSFGFIKQSPFRRMNRSTNIGI